MWIVGCVDTDCAGEAPERATVAGGAGGAVQESWAGLAMASVPSWASRLGWMLWALGQVVCTARQVQASLATLVDANWASEAIWAYQALLVRQLGLVARIGRVCVVSGQEEIALFWRKAVCLAAVLQIGWKKACVVSRQHACLVVHLLKQKTKSCILSGRRVSVACGARMT